MTFNNSLQLLIPFNECLDGRIHMLFFRHKLLHFHLQLFYLLIFLHTPLKQFQCFLPKNDQLFFHDGYFLHVVNLAL